jgi:hypothetical protein
MGPNSSRCTKSRHNVNICLFFLPSLFLPYKDMFMNDYDEISNYNGLKYNPSQNFDNF